MKFIIESLSHEGRGLTHLDGKTTFVEGALPQEIVTLKMLKKHRRYDEAKVLEVLVPSLERVKPACPHVDLCGGCSLQHQKIEAQLAHKQAVVLEQLEHFGGVRPLLIVPPLRGPISGYRRKARLGVKYVPKKGQVLVGFREKQGHFLADLQVCEILDPSVGKQLPALKTLVQGLEAYQQIPQIEVAVGDDHAALVFRHLQPLLPSDKDQLRRFAQTKDYHLYLQPAGLDSVYRLWPEEGPSELVYHLPSFKLSLGFHPMDFVQINREVNRALVDQAISWLTLSARDSVLDLFCGLGNFSLPMACISESVMGVEGSEGLVNRARDNASRNGLTNVHFQTADLFETSFDAPWAQASYDKILLDPPRSGAVALLPWLGEQKPETIVYVSCHPASLARDLGILSRDYGYQITQLGIADMFPHTTHVETIVQLKKG